MMIKLKWFCPLALCIALCFLTACGKNTFEKQLEALQAIEKAMRMNVDNPEALFSALDECIEKYTPVWEESSRQMDFRTYESVSRELSLQDEEIRSSMSNIVDLDLEIQDRYEDNPEVLKAYFSRIRKIGIRELPTNP